MSRSVVPAKRSADAAEDKWVAEEDRFVLQQARKKAVLRAKSGRAQPIDWLMVILVAIDPNRNAADADLNDEDLEIMNPQAMFDTLDDGQLRELEKKIEGLQAIETNKSNHDYWTMMKAICRDKLSNSKSSSGAARGIGTVVADLDKLLGNKNLAELEKLEKQVRSKLDSNEPIDTDYWEHLLKSLLTYKAKAKLSSISKTILERRSKSFRQQQVVEANALRQRLTARLSAQSSNEAETEPENSLDPEPLLRIRPEDKALKLMSLQEWSTEIVSLHGTMIIKADQIQSSKQSQIVKSGYVPGKTKDLSISKRQKLDVDGEPTACDREVARGLADNEELLAAADDVETKNRHLWSDKYQPRKPQHFVRAQLGFDWNKYNQTHYDQDNPPPKVVQGYKFNVFYPDLVDKSKAPTYRIERENGRRRGQTITPAGEDDTCLIRFTAGAPYEDIAFRIVDKEWDYSAKRERGFQSSFDKDVLRLQFQFKKIYYRK